MTIWKDITCPRCDSKQILFKELDTGESNKIKRKKMLFYIKCSNCDYILTRGYYWKEE